MWIEGGGRWEVGIHACEVGGCGLREVGGGYACEVRTRCSVWVGGCGGVG